MSTGGFSIKKPSGRRKSFSVHRKIYRAGQRPQQPKVEDERIDSINELFRLGKINEQSALNQIKQVIKSIKEKEGFADSLVNRAIASEDNFALFERFWARKYERNKKILRKHTVRNEFNFALKSLGNISLLTISEEELEELCNQVFEDNQHKRYVGRINSLLIEAKRGFTLKVRKPPKQRVKYVNWAELQKILTHVQDENLKCLYVTLYCTGVRLGEAFMLNPDKVERNKPLPVKQQLTDDMKIRDRKNKTECKTIILDFGFNEVKAWTELDEKLKFSYRKRCQHHLIYAARKAFPREPEKQVSPHDLRHSFVMYLLGKGVSITQAAKLIGDTVRTTEMHYSDIIQSSEEFELVQNILKQNNHPAK